MSKRSVAAVAVAVPVALAAVGGVAAVGERCETEARK